MVFLRLLSFWMLFSSTLVLALEPQLPSIEKLNLLADQADWGSGVSESIIIDAPRESVWNYVSHSASARDWSVFFSHISPLPGLEDGQVGSLRRCFRNSDEKGFRWDEVTTLVEPLKFRQITTYNLRGFPTGFMTRGGFVFVRQLFRSLSETQTELTFQTVSPHNSKTLHRMMFDRSREDTSRIFRQNLTNIKALVEGDSRVFQWE